MTAAPRLLLPVNVVAVFAQLLADQKSKELTIQEPGTYELASLFKQADTTALVKKVAGDTEAYDVCRHLQGRGGQKLPKIGPAERPSTSGHTWGRDSRGSTSCSCVTC
jgi:hypothetical protein